jgi:alginate O-acetyltransferase complex protein AlgJ
MGLERAPDWSRPRPDREAPVATTQVGDDGGGLFGDAEIPVTLVGTSYSLRGNFHGYLEEALGASVLNAAKDGAGFLKSMTEYLGDDAYRDAPPRVIVWEVPERFLQAPLDGEPGWAARVGLAR